MKRVVILAATPILSFSLFLPVSADEGHDHGATTQNTQTQQQDQPTETSTATSTKDTAPTHDSGTQHTQPQTLGDSTTGATPTASTTHSDQGDHTHESTTTTRSTAQQSAQNLPVTGFNPMPFILAVGVGSAMWHFLYSSLKDKYNSR